MKIEKSIKANLAAVQLVYWFNKRHTTAISIRSEHREGVPFIIIDFGVLPADTIFSFAFMLGETQKELEITNSYALNHEKFPFPEDGDPLYVID